MAWFAGRWSLRGTGTPFSRPVNLAQHILVFGLRMYRRLVSPLLTSAFGPMGLGCRFTPTCSEYALGAVTVHGALKGSWLAACRLGRCHPWGGCGFDPVPPRGLPGSGSRRSRGRQADRGGRRNPTPAGGAPGSVLRSFAPACCREETAQKTPRLVTRSNGS